MGLIVRLFDRQLDGSDKLVGEIDTSDIVAKVAVALQERAAGASPAPLAAPKKPSVMQKLADGRWVDAESPEAKREAAESRYEALNGAANEREKRTLPAATGAWSKRTEPGVFYIKEDGQKLAAGTPEAAAWLREQRSKGAIA